MLLSTFRTFFLQPWQWMATFSTTVWKGQRNQGVSIYVPSNQIGSLYDDTGSKSIRVLEGR